VRRRNRLKAIAMATLLSAGAAYALASWDWCDWPPPSPPKVAFAAHADGPLLAGAAAVELNPPYPVVAAGYGPPRPEVSSAHHPLRARAVVLKQGALSFGLVSLDVLLIPDDVAAEIRSRAGLNEAWVVATHTHSSFGGYDARWIAQLAGTGRFRDAARRALVDGAVEALVKASADASPAQLEIADGEADLSLPRSGTASDGRITRVKFLREGKPPAQWWLMAAHPTLVPRKPSALDPDYPGAVDGIVLQTAVGNASAKGDAFAERVAKAFDALNGEAVEAPLLSVARVRVDLPAPDASRLVPSLFTMPGRNFLCASASKQADVAALRLGPLALVAVPAEVTFGAQQVLGARVLSVANGYLGYVEPADTVDRRDGESVRQYYGRALLETLKSAADAASSASAPEP
jgi:neutral ceramidase